MTKFETRVRVEWPEQADRILDLIHGNIDPDTFPSVAQWLDQCHHPPSRHDRIALALNEELNGHGVEAVFPDDEYQPAFEYINMGDTYDTTLVYLVGRGWRVSTWGDEAERLGL